MSEQKNAETDLTPKQRAIYKAQVVRTLSNRRRELYEKMSPSEKEEFFYKVYVYLDKNRDRVKETPIFRPGLPKIVASKKVYRINELGVLGGFDISMFKLFERLHKAFREVEAQELQKLFENEIDE